MVEWILHIFTLLVLVFGCLNLSHEQVKNVNHFFVDTCLDAVSLG